MKVFLKPQGLYSRAMTRVADALAARAPDCVQVVENQEEADLTLLHVIGEMESPSYPHIINQYCLHTAGGSLEYWLERWNKATMVWSYYDLMAYAQGSYNFYFAPLGVDKTFRNSTLGNGRDVGVMTSGYVSAPNAEAIEEVVMAADWYDLQHIHLGPDSVEGLRCKPPRLKFVHNISDESLAYLYRRTEWVSGLRHVEGFELPALEGLMCGARPLLFDRPDMTQWYEGHGVFIPESSGDELVQYLVDLLAYRPAPVTLQEREYLAQKFNWGIIAKGFWNRIV